MFYFFFGVGSDETSKEEGRSVGYLTRLGLSPVKYMVVYSIFTSLSLSLI